MIKRKLIASACILTRILWRIKVSSAMFLGRKGGSIAGFQKKKRNTNSSLVNKNLHTIGRKKKCLFHGIHGFTGDIMFCIALYCFFVFFFFCGFVVISWPKSCVLVWIQSYNLFQNEFQDRMQKGVEKICCVGCVLILSSSFPPSEIVNIFGSQSWPFVCVFDSELEFCRTHW